MNYVSLYKPSGMLDAMGQPDGNYVWVDDVWADIRPTTAREYTASRQTEAAIDAVIIVPYRMAAPAIEATWIIVYGNEKYDIQSQAEIGYHEGTRLLARVRQP